MPGRVERQGSMAEIGRTLRELILEASAHGTLTHAHALYGSVLEDQAKISAQLLPGGRDIFDLASLTKALVTTPLVFRDIASNRISLATTLDEWLGAAASDLAPAVRALSVRSLLRHETGLPAWRNFWINHLGIEGPELPAAQRLERVVTGTNRAAGQVAVGAPSVYSDVGFLLLGAALERAHGTDLAVQFADMCRNELRLDALELPLQYGNVLNLADRFVPTTYCPVRRQQLIGKVHDENCASLGGVTGHAGLFGTGAGLAAYLSRLIASPIGRLLWQENAGARILPPGSPPNESLMGWRQGADPNSAPFGGGKTMGHYGFTGVAFWICPETQDYAIFLTNRVIGGRTRPGIADLRRAVFSALNQARN